MAELGRVPELRIELSARSRRALVQALVVAGLGAAGWVFLATFAARHGYFDLRVYYGAVNFWVNDGGQIYDYLVPTTSYGFTYPPFAALAMSPMAVVSWHGAIAISLVLSLSSMYMITYWLVAPVIKRNGWPRWFAMALALEIVAVLEPVRETINFGQVNLLLLAMIMADAMFLMRRGHRLAGIGVGLATAIKLTPGVFILYLLVTRRWKAAGTAVATAGAATWLAATVAPDASRVFWTDALWNTDRVGSTAFISNQSLNGIVSRLNPVDPSTVIWATLALITLVIWMMRVRRAVDVGDEMAAVALTGVFGCLVSPITWVHHLVWAVPSLILLADHGMDPARGRRSRRAVLAGAVGAMTLLSSRIVWSFEYQYQGWGYLGSNMYAYALCLLLIGTPIRPADPVRLAGPRTEPPATGDVPDLVDLVDLDRRVTEAFDARDAARGVEGAARPLVKAGTP